MNYYKHWLGILYTPGIKELADNHGAYWLIDAIASYQPKLKKNPRLQDFQLWNLTVTNNSAALTCREDTNIKPVVTQKIEYTDFPNSIKIYVVNNVILLPEEY